MRSPLITLNNGVEIPQLGLGVYDPQFGDETERAILAALECGYRHIDTATVYRNEAQVGAALKNSGLPREEIFVTTKVWDTDQGYDKTLHAFEQSLKALKTDYIDLYLVHWPVRETRKETWRALEHLFREKRLRAIGVSNYLAPHLEELLTYAEIIPAVNQFEITPFLQSPETTALCQKHGIHVESYSPLVRGRKKDHQSLQNLAQKYNRSSYQILIRWALDRGFITIPKSSTPERIRDNFSVFDFSLSAEDLNLMNSFHDGTRVAADPMTYL